MKTTWSAHSLNWHIVALWSDFHPSTRDGASANKQVNHLLRTFNWWRHGPHFAGAGKSTSSALCLQAPAIEFKTFERLQIASNMFQNGNTFHQPKVNKSVVWRENSKRETAPKEKRLLFLAFSFWWKESVLDGRPIFIQMWKWQCLPGNLSLFPMARTELRARFLHWTPRQPST